MPYCLFLFMQNYQILFSYIKRTANRLERHVLRHHAKFCGDRSQTYYCKDSAFSRFSIAKCKKNSVDDEQYRITRESMQETVKAEPHSTNYTEKDQHEQCTKDAMRLLHPKGREHSP